MAAISSTMDPTVIETMGYLPFAHPILLDHRTIYVDFDSDKLFCPHIPDISKISFKAFSLPNRKQVKKYLTTLEGHYNNSLMLEKVQELKEQINVCTGQDQHTSLIEQCKRLEAKSTELMHVAEKSIYKAKYESSFWSSKVLTQAADNLCQLKKEQRFISITYMHNSNDLLQAKDIEIDKAIKYLRECQNNSDKLRQDDLDDTVDLLS